VVIPQAMAYASIAGLPVQVGPYTALVPMLVYVVLGSSRSLSVSSTSTISMLTAAELSAVVQSGASEDLLIIASTLALLVGVFLVLAGLLRLGFLANFISAPVLTGFKAGIGVVIFVGQLGKVLGLSVPKGPLLQTVITLLGSLGEVHWPTLALALITLAVLILLPRLAPRVPAALVAVAGGIAASALLNLGGAGVKLVGRVPPGLPALSLPDLSLVGALWPGALGIALMSFVESIAAGRAFARQGDPAPDANQELVALGLANVAGGLTQAYPAGGGTSQTAVNAQAGARTQVAQAVTAGVSALTLSFLAPLLGLMPQATLGALVLLAAVGLVKVGDFQAIARVRRLELGWALVTFLGVMVLGTLQGIVVAVVLSMLVLVYEANRPPVHVIGRKPGTDVFRPLADHPGDETFPGLLMLRPVGLLYFASAPRALEKMWSLVREAEPRVLALDCSAVPNIEYTALAELSEFEERLKAEGVTLWLAALNPDAFQVVERAPLGKTLGHERMYFNLEQAVEAYQEYNGRGSGDSL